MFPVSFTLSSPLHLLSLVPAQMPYLQEQHELRKQSQLPSQLHIEIPSRPPFLLVPAQVQYLQAEERAKLPEELRSRTVLSTHSCSTPELAAKAVDRYVL